MISGNSVEDRVIEILKNKPLNYVEAKKQSEEIDKVLGFSFNEVEEALLNQSKIYKQSGKNLWLDIHVQSHQTPYFELLEIMNYFENESIRSVFDFGAGYGRFGIILNIFYPHIKFKGYEISKERVCAAKEIYRNLGYDPESMICEDIATDQFSFTDFDMGFIYDFGSNDDMNRFLKNLKKQLNGKEIIIVARGKAIRHFILNEQHWLSKVKEPYHTPHWSVFRS